MTSQSQIPLRIALDATNARVERCEGYEYTYDEELDDERSVIQDACSLISQTPGLRFVVAGFSDEPWPVDVETDLAVVLEQLPATLQALRNNREAVLDFYEQGIERTLVMSGETDAVEVACLKPPRHLATSPDEYHRGP